MDRYEAQTFLLKHHYIEIREKANLDCFIYQKDNKLIRLFELSNGDMVYLESKVKLHGVNNEGDIKSARLELEELKNMVEVLKTKLSK